MEAILPLFHNFSKKMAILQLEQEKFSMEGPQGDFQLLDVFIAELKSHMTC